MNSWIFLNKLNESSRDFWLFLCIGCFCGISALFVSWGIFQITLLVSLCQVWKIEWMSHLRIYCKRQLIKCNTVQTKQSLKRLMVRLIKRLFFYYFHLIVASRKLNNDNHASLIYQKRMDKLHNNGAFKANIFVLCGYCCFSMYINSFVNKNVF